jgi:putative membrane protein insertion efficiency factor
VKRPLTGALLWLISAYQRRISPAFPRRCRYEPTCSAYTAQAIRELGPARGLIVGGWRLLRCNPFSNGGIDDLADRRLFRKGGPRKALPAAGESSSSGAIGARS